MLQSIPYCTGRLRVLQSQSQTWKCVMNILTGDGVDQGRLVRGDRGD